MQTVAFHLTLGTALLTAVTALASQQALVSPGERIRIKHACEGDVKAAPCDPIVGKVRSVSGDTIRLDGGRQLVLNPATKVELSSGRHGHALLGLGLGIVAGAAVGALTVHDCHSAHSGSDMGGLCVLRYFVTVPAGALTGIIVGAMLKSEKWQTLQRPISRLEVVPTVMPDGVGFSANLRF